MRNLLSAVLAAIVTFLGLLAAAGDARATATITLEWGACGGGAGGCAGVGTNSLTVFYPGGQTLRLDIFLQHDEVTGMGAQVFSLNFDTDLLNELNLTAGMAPVEWAGTDTHPGPAIELYGPFTAGSQGTADSTAVSAGRINSFESGSALSTNLPRTGVAYTVGSFTATAPARYRVAQAFFTVTSNVVLDGADVFAGSFNGGFDVSVNGLNQPVTMNFGTASVQGVESIPEPGSGALLGLGLLGLLVLVRRQNRRDTPMRSRLPAVLVAIVTFLGMLGAAGDAGATATITLEWGDCGGGSGGCAGVGTSTLTVDWGGGQTLRLDIFLTHDEVLGLGAHVFSLNFDTDLGNELNLTGGMSPLEWAGTDTHPGPATELYGPFTAGLGGTRESTGLVAGRLNSFDSATLYTPLPRTGLAYTVGTFTATAPARYRVGQVFFTVNAGFVISDGADIFAGAFNAGFDVSVNGLYQPVTMNFGTASLNAKLIPEPGTVSLLGMGLIGLVLVRRRSRRS
jgi:hypothetical protein